MDQYISKDISILDFGCGLGKLKDYLDQHFLSYNISYTGVDIVPEFLKTCKKKYPHSSFITLKELMQNDCSYDVILCSGTFSILTSDYNSHEEEVLKVLEKLYFKTKIVLLVDFMHDEVDFQQNNAYHVNINSIMKKFAKLDFTNIVVNRDFLPYEVGFQIKKKGYKK